MSEIDTVLAALSAAEHARKETVEARRLEYKKWQTEWIKSADGLACKHAALQDMWVLTALTMTTAEIKPVWTLDSLTPDESDTISLYGETVDNRESDTEREIQLEDVPVGEPTRLRNREWDARKSMAKERVREARLKSQIATRVAEKEEERFVRMFGELDDAESRFSEYDLTEDEDEGVAEMEA